MTGLQAEGTHICCKEETSSKITPPELTIKVSVWALAYVVLNSILKTIVKLL